MLDFNLESADDEIVLRLAHAGFRHSAATHAQSLVPQRDRLALISNSSCFSPHELPVVLETDLAFKLEAGCTAEIGMACKLVCAGAWRGWGSLI